jgi:anaerobic ribonucleoside-triphosphate reductase activating protein
MVPETWDSGDGYSISAEEMAKVILSCSNIDGITVSGGEPFEQPAALTQILAAVKASGKNTWVYTGYPFEDLVSRDDEAIDRMLACVDVLVDGPYKRDQAGLFLFRGSANQRIIRLTDAIPQEELEKNEASRITMTLDDKGHLIVIGIPPPDFLCNFREGLEKRDIHTTSKTKW